MKKGSIFQFLAAFVAILFLVSACTPAAEEKNSISVNTSNKPSLSVELATVEQKTIPFTLLVNGSLSAWQEATISSQLSGVRLADLRVEVGDTVKKGQVLALFDQEPVKADHAQARASVVEAEALFDQAKLNADMIREITEQGAVSAQERNQILTAEKAARARLLSAKAQQTQQGIRLRHTTVRSPDNGIISLRTATLGAVPNHGQELFRLIRQNRLEWQAEVTASELGMIKEGMSVSVLNESETYQGTVRRINPIINLQSRTGLVYVDIASTKPLTLKPGMYLKGQIHLGQKNAMLIPQSSVIERDGFTYVFMLKENSNQVQRIKLNVNNKAHGEFIEVIDGLKPGDKVVKSGVAFLAHGDFVKVIQ
jgi:RND family efflux transporter MFP subunit